MALTVYFGENTEPGGEVVLDPVTARNQFLARLDNTVQTEDFEGFQEPDEPPLALSFDGSAGAITATLTGIGQIYSSDGAGRFATSGVNLFEVVSDFQITFDTPISAFGFYGTDIGDFAGQLTVTLVDTDAASTTLTVNNLVNGPDGMLLFWGFVDDAKRYVSITFGNTGGPGDVFGFDDMVVADLGQIVVPAVPQLRVSRGWGRTYNTLTVRM
jgi:hypothetical protein